MFILLPKSELQCFIFFCNVRMLIQIITKVQFGIVTDISEMNMIHLICKSIFGISPIKGNAVCFGRYSYKTISLQDLSCSIFKPVNGIAFEDLQHILSYEFCTVQVMFKVIAAFFTFRTGNLSPEFRHETKAFAYQFYCIFA